MKIFAIDRDPNVRALAEKLEQEFAGRLSSSRDHSPKCGELLAAQNVKKVNGIGLDIRRVVDADRPARARFFVPYRWPARYAHVGASMSAADLVNSLSEEELANTIYDYGEERASRRIARAIVKAREEKPIETTAELAAIVRRVLPKKE